MRKGTRYGFVVLCAVCVIGAGAGGALTAQGALAFGTETAQAKKETAEGLREAERKRSYEVGRLSLPAEADRLVVVEADGLSANVMMYEKRTDTVKTGPGEKREESFWVPLLSTDAGLIGRAGMGKEREGDQKTPTGLYRMNTPFGTGEAQTGFPENYLQVDSRYYWNGDPASDRYNRLVRVDEYSSFDRAKSEHLSTYGGVAYRYCIDTGYNAEGTPGRGSALFLHCSGGANTAGCVAVPEEVMTEILRAYREGSTWILLDVRGNFAQYESDETAE